MAGRTRGFLAHGSRPYLGRLRRVTGWSWCRMMLFSVHVADALLVADQGGRHRADRAGSGGHLRGSRCFPGSRSSFPSANAARLGPRVEPFERPFLRRDFPHRDNIKNCRRVAYVCAYPGGSTSAIDCKIVKMQVGNQRQRRLDLASLRQPKMKRHTQRWFVIVQPHDVATATQFRDLQTTWQI